MPPAIDLRGRRVGRLVIFGRVHPEERGRTHGEWWWCQCDCGTVAKIAGQSLRGYKGKEPTQSCGCLQRETVARQSAAASAANARPWTAEEDAVLLAHGVAEASLLLDRSYPGCSHRLARLRAKD